MKTRIAEQLERILREVTTPEDIAEVEKVIREAKGNVVQEPAEGFWEEKTPCWEMIHCQETIRDKCPAFKHQSLPCWEIEGTYNKVHEHGLKGDNTQICEHCRVRKRWGHGDPIHIKLFGKGLNPVVDVDEDGFLVQPEVWTEEVARLLAVDEVPWGLTEEHWKIINYLRRYYLELESVPPVRKLTRDTGYNLKEIYRLFPSGGLNRGACRLAGIPNITTSRYRWDLRPLGAQVIKQETRDREMEEQLSSSLV
jgi:tRNA 2-thiouridine synthesizing protein E